ncbi:MAG: hypothetical protein COB93_00195 [Sneathiella sp.]|nr:MAG: hypothetical protein COB93_00195 [Sneathiella sp.]
MIRYFALSLLFSCSAAAQQLPYDKADVEKKFICFETMKVQFDIKDGEAFPVSVEPPLDRFSITKVGGNETQYIYQSLTQTDYFLFCDAGLSFGTEPTIVCGSDPRVDINLDTKRFTSYSYFGWSEFGAEYGTKGPSLSVGHCDQIN